MTLEQKLKLIRAINGVTQEYVAHLLQIWRTDYTKLERGLLKKNLKYITSLSTHFGINEHWLRDNQSPVFVRNSYITLPRNTTSPSRTMNEWDNTIRLFLPEVLREHGISSCQIMSPKGKGYSHLFVFHSRNGKIEIEVNDKDNLQFFDALQYVIKEAGIKIKYLTWAKLKTNNQKMIAVYLSPDVYRHAQGAAASQGKSINAWLSDILKAKGGK